MTQQSGSQTVGPFFAIGLTVGGENDLLRRNPAGTPIYIEGRVLDGDGEPINDALVEIWQADGQGIYNHPNDPRHEQADPHFTGFGRCGTNDEGSYSFTTIKPGRVPFTETQTQAPHLNVRVFSRGMLLHADTRLYFADEPSNEDDPVLNSIGDTARRQTLIAQRLESSAYAAAYRFDIVLQGENETAFFEP